METTVTKKLMRVISRKTDDTIELFLAPLENMEKVILRRALLRVLESTSGLRGISLDHIEEIVDLIRSGSTGSRVSLPDGVRATKSYSILTITSSAQKKLREYTLEIPGETILKEAGLVLIASIADERTNLGDGKSEAAFNFDALTFPLRIRARRPGDFFYPFGLGERKKIQDFFVDEKVPRDMRDTVPLLFSGDDLIWIVGHRIDDRYRVSPPNRRILKILIKKARS
jgi:tRNA(Ile)-lysidine synthase